MLDKLVLNNQILANKAVVQKVRVNLVNKQVQKLRKVKQLSEKHKDNKKLQVKIVKAAEVLTALKKIKSNEILRNALLNEKKAQAILTNGLSSPEEIAQALYFSHKTIQAIVTQLKSILNISDSDTSWREQVIEPSKRKKKQMRTEKKLLMRLENKSRKKLDHNRTQWLEENAPEIGESESLPETVDRPQRKQRTNSLQLSFMEEDADIEPTTHEEAQLQPIKQEKKQKASKKVTSAISAPPLTEENETIEDVSDDGDDTRPTPHTIDDFFITQSGDHYRSTVVIDRKQMEAPNDGLVRKERRSMQNGYQRYPNKKRQYNETSRNSHSNNKRDFKRNDRKNDSKPFVKSNGVAKFGPKIEEPQEKLHPSWAAKQKQKRIDTFQGSKIVFDDDGASSKGSKSKVTEKIVKAEGAGDSKEKLHPSWAAKQKQKPSITEFKGQKIVFGDD